MTMMDIQAQGAKAWDDGAAREANPYAGGEGWTSVQRDAWFAGWDYAETVDED